AAFESRQHAGAPEPRPGRAAVRSAMRNGSFEMKTLHLAAATAALSLLLPALARAERPCQCSDLPKMESQLFEQEWLQKAFREYDGTDPMGAYVGDPQTMVNNITHRLNQWEAGESGGSAKGGGPLGHG